MRASLAFIATLLLAGQVTAQEAPAPRWFLNQVSSAALEQDLRQLTGHDPVQGPQGPESIRSRNIHHPQIALAAAWLEQRLAEIPELQLRREEFDAEGVEGLVNLVAELPGHDPELPWLVVGAHYDSIASRDEDWDPQTDIAPGADDDASGVVAVLEIARRLADWPPGFAHPLRFVLFSAEEYGLQGSVHHVASMEPGQEVALMLSLDPIGYNPAGGDVLWFTYDDASWEDAAALEERAQAVGSPLRATGVHEADIGGDERSDHHPFWQAGHPALHLGSFPQPSSYHTTLDDLEVVDLEYLSTVTALVAAHLAGLAEPMPEPARSCACNSGERSAGGWTYASALLLSALLHHRRSRLGPALDAGRRRPC
jgi:hypothetical protein